VGVITVENNLTIVPTESRLDEEIAKDIERALDRNYYVDADEMAVRVDHGIVTLMGVTNSTIARTQAEEVAMHTEGVMDVQNDLRLIIPA